jgi:hypothetical protein
MSLFVCKQFISSGNQFTTCSQMKELGLSFGWSRTTTKTGLCSTSSQNASSPRIRCRFRKETYKKTSQLCNKLIRCRFIRKLANYVKNDQVPIQQRNLQKTSQLCNKLIRCRLIKETYKKTSQLCNKIFLRDKTGSFPFYATRMYRFCTYHSENNFILKTFGLSEAFSFTLYM